MATAGTQPYVPNLVPTTRQYELGDLERYLYDEFTRISLAMQQTTVQASYGGLVQRTPSVNPDAQIAPQKLDTFDGFVPDLPLKVTTDVDANDIIVTEPGVYWASLFMTVDIQSGQVYRATLAINDVLASVFAAEDTSNQTDTVSMSFGGITSLNRGDRVSIYYGSTQADAGFDVVAASLQIYRISELQQGTG